MFTIKTVLHPTDFSAHSACAFELASLLARQCGARLILLHVVPRQPLLREAGDSLARSRAEHYEEDAQSYRAEMAERLGALAVEPGISVERVLREGEVVPAILQVAREAGCELIVMGTQGRSGQRVMGGVAQEVTGKAPCPVLTAVDPAWRGRPAELSALARA